MMLQGVLSALYRCASWSSVSGVVWLAAVDGHVVVEADDEVATAAERYGARVVGEKLRDWSAGDQVPDPHRAVPAAGDSN
ncbi:hypothetical protein, partial [Streptomyces sp. SID4941]|uniref:hypothetical protein n=1 Tax=Streptomyces sp. SID4941 TaxID=2690283 RepID=UPI001F34897C